MVGLVIDVAFIVCVVSVPQRRFRRTMWLSSWIIVNVVQWQLVRYRIVIRCHFLTVKFRRKCKFVTLARNRFTTQKLEAWHNPMKPHFGVSWTWESTRKYTFSLSKRKYMSSQLHTRSRCSNYRVAWVWSVVTSTLWCLVLCTPKYCRWRCRRCRLWFIHLKCTPMDVVGFVCNSEHEM